MATHIYAQDGVPVALVASSLSIFRDNTGVGIRMVFQNLGTKHIQAVYFSLICTSLDGRTVQHVDNLELLDLDVRPTATFGNHVLVCLQESDIREYTVIMDKVIYKDDSTWENTGKKAFAPLEAPQPLASLDELEEQYRRSVPKPVQKCLAKDYGNLWRCGCGQLNLKTTQEAEQICIACGSSLTALLGAADLDTLRKGKRANKVKYAAQEAATKKKDALKLKLGYVFVALIVIVVVTLSFIANSGSGRYRDESSGMHHSSY